MNKRKLLNFINFLINSYKAGTTNINIAHSLANSTTYKKIGEILIKEITENKTPLSIALRKHNLAPTHFTYLLEAGEESGKIIEILNSYKKILEDNLKIENEIKIYKFYFLFMNVLLIFGIALFYFIFNNIVAKVVEDKSSSFYKTIELIQTILSLPNVILFVLFLVIMSLLLSFRNSFLDWFEYFILGKPYRNIGFSQIMNIWGNLINAGIPINLALFISISSIENNIFKSFLNSAFSNLTEKYRKIDRETISKIIDIFPQDYRINLKNSFVTGNIDEELIESSKILYEESSRSLKNKVIFILVTIIVLSILILGSLIVVSFLSIYLPLLEGIN